MSSLAEHIKHFAKAYYSSPAITYYHRFRITCYTYGDIFALANKCAAYLLAEDMKQGDCLLVRGENSPEWVVLMLAAALTGITLVPVDIKSSQEFIDNVQQQTAAKPIALDSLFERIQDADLSLLETSQNKITGEDIFEILYTSGTTAAPKGAVIRHRHLIASITSMRQRLNCKPRSTFLSMLPLSHVLEQNAGCLSVLRFGGHIIYTKEIRFSRLFEILSKEKVTYIVAVPAILKSFKNKILEKLKCSQLEAISKVPRILRPTVTIPIRKRVGRYLKAFICGGAPLDHDTEAFWEMLGIKVVQGYGLTESCAIATVNTFQSRTKGSVGKPLPGLEIKLGEKDEILLRGDNIISEYFPPVEGAFSEGWYHTGDVGKFDAEGNLYILGRIKEMILTSNGLNIFPTDIEKILSRSPAIKESAVFEDPECEGRLIGGIIFNPGYQETDIEMLLKKANFQLASHQQLSQIAVWKTFPKTPSLKLKRRELPLLYQKQAQNKKAPDKQDPLLQILAEIANVSPDALKPNTILTQDLGLDSLNLVDLVIRLESHYRREIDEATLANACTIQKLRQELSKTAPKPPPLPSFYYSRPGKILGRSLRCVLEHGIVRRWVSFKRQGDFPSIDLKRPTLFIANHSSHVDTFAVLNTLPREVKNKLLVAAAYDYFFSKEKKGHFLMNPLTVPMFPFHRDRFFSENLKQIGIFLSRGHPLLIFPEGTRSRTGKLGPFKEGIGMIVKETGAQVIPSQISGAFDLWPPAAAYPKRGPVSVHYQEPLLFSSTDTPQSIAKTLEYQFNK